MQHKILPSYVLKTKRNNITALGIYYGILSNEWGNVSNYYVYTVLGREEWAKKEWSIFINDFMH